MTDDRVTTLVLALCCLFALGVSAATLDSSVDTTPDEVIDYSYDSLPLSSDEAGNLKQQIQSNPRDLDSDSQSQSSSQTQQGENNPQRSAPRSQQRESNSRRSEHSQSARARISSGPSPVRSHSQSRSSATGGEGTSNEPKPLDLLDRLLALLMALFDLLVSLLPVFLVLGMVATAIRYPDRLQALLDRLGLGRSQDTNGETETPLVAVPTNDVATAWFEMVRRLGLADETTRTPHEVADEAIQTGVDPEVVTDVTEPFEEVRYGDASVSEQRRTRAREGIERFRAQHRDRRDE